MTDIAFEIWRVSKVTPSTVAKKTSTQASIFALTLGQKD
jgi:hypothetical protein